MLVSAPNSPSRFVFDIPAAAALIGSTERWLADKLRAGALGHKVARRWMLTEEDLREILRICAVPATDSELRGIMRGGVAALPRLMERGRFLEPKSVTEAKAAFITASDSVRCWIEENCERHPDAWVKRTELYVAFWSQSISEGPKSLSKRQFYSRVEQIAGISKATRDGYEGYKGIGLKDRTRGQHRRTTGRHRSRQWKRIFPQSHRITGSSPTTEPPQPVLRSGPHSWRRSLRTGPYAAGPRRGPMSAIRARVGGQSPQPVRHRPVVCTSWRTSRTWRVPAGWRSAAPSRT